MENTTQKKDWLAFLSDEDLAFLKRFLLSSGSLKEVARQYGISYPTVRIRLDRLIAKVEAVEQVDASDDYQRLLRSMFADGRYDAQTLRQLLESYETIKKGAEL